MRTRKRNSFKRKNNIRRKNTNRTRRKVSRKSSRKSSRKQHRRKRTNRRRLNMRGGDGPCEQSITLHKIDNDQGSRGFFEEDTTRSATVTNDWSALMWFPTALGIMGFIADRVSQPEKPLSHDQGGPPNTRIHGRDEDVGAAYQVSDGPGFAIHVGVDHRKSPGDPAAGDGWLTPNMIHIFPHSEIIPESIKIGMNHIPFGGWDYYLEMSLQRPPGAATDRWKFRFKSPTEEELAAAHRAVEMEI